MANEYLVVNGITLMTSAWWIESLAALDNDTDVRGANRPLWRATGMRGRRRWPTETVYPFKLIVAGEFDHTGAPTSDARQTRIDNLDYLKANLGQALATGDGSVTCVHHRYDSTTRTAQAHVIGPTNTKRGTDSQSALTISRSDLFLSVAGGVWT